MTKNQSKFTVIRDTRENKKFGWMFEPSDRCLGTVQKALSTGDYSIEGLESIFTIERKRNTAEIYKNIMEKRFTRELQRFATFAHTFVICEFTVENIIEFPVNSGIPRHKWPILKYDGKYILRCLNELMIKYDTKLIFAGAYGKEVSLSIMKRMQELYAT